MRFEVEVPIPMLERIEDWLGVRMIEIDGHSDRMTIADKALTLLLVEGRKAMKAEKRKRKDGFANIAGGLNDKR